MNEEEKLAIEILKERKKDLLESSKNSFYSSDRELYKEHVEAIDTLLNLIDKQQKEIERIKNFNYNTYIRKDTIRHIRDKAECMDYYSLNDVIDDLSKLLGE